MRRNDTLDAWALSSAVRRGRPRSRGGWFGSKRYRFRGSLDFRWSLNAEVTSMWGCNINRWYRIPVRAKQPDDGDGTLSEAFWRVARELRHQSRETLEPWGVTPSQSRALGVLLRHGVIRLSELSDHLHIAARSTTEVVD